MFLFFFLICLVWRTFSQCAWFGRIHLSSRFHRHHIEPRHCKGHRHFPLKSWMLKDFPWELMASSSTGVMNLCSVENPISRMSLLQEHWHPHLVIPRMLMPCPLIFLHCFSWFLVIFSKENSSGCWIGFICPKLLNLASSCLAVLSSF